MNNVLEDSLFVSQNRKFDEIQSIVRQFSAEYVGNSIIKDNIFAVIQNYARKKEIALEMLRYPIHDDELWALTFLKQDTIFVCVNTALPLCKQFFAAAHELYHIYCYVENADQSYIKNGSMLDSATGDETGRTQEDLEANAFAGLLLMPDQLLHEQILLYGLDKDLVTVDSVLMLMDMPSDYCRCPSHPYSNNCNNKLRRIFARPRDELPSVWHSLHSLYAAMESGCGVCHFGSCLWFPAVCNCCHCCNFPKQCRRPARIYSAVKTDPRLLHFL